MNLEQDARQQVVSALRSRGVEGALPAPDDPTNYRRLLPDYLQSKLPVSVLNGAVPGSGARVVRDRFGVPHIFAETEVDLWCASGFVQAQDRLWQLDYRHRVATGTLAEVFGDDALGSDLENRTIGLGRAAEDEFAHIDDRSGVALEAYAYGVNAWIELAAGNFPVEFEVLEYEPALWSPVASLAVLRQFWWSLTGRLFQIVGAERVIRNSSAQIADLVLTSEAHEFIVPDGSGLAPSQADGGGDDGTGSNNWVVGPSKMTTGMPAVAVMMAQVPITG